MRDVDTDALKEVARSLGIGNPATVLGQVSFQDDVLQQVLLVNTLVRAARARPIQSSGIISFGQELVHPGADQQQESFDPYTIPITGGAGEAVPPWPTVEERQFLDCWVFSVKLSKQDASGAGGLSSAFMGSVGIPIGASSGIQPGVVLAEFDGLVTTSIGDQATEIGSGLVTPRILPIRVAKGATLRTRTISTGAVTFEGQWVLGWFPRGLGQDYVLGTS